jgi:hypothetical protein
MKWITDGNHPRQQHTRASKRNTCLSIQLTQPKMLIQAPAHDLANSWAAFRLHEAIGSPRQLQKPSSSEGNDDGSGRSGITPTYQEYHSEQLKGSKNPNDVSVHPSFFFCCKSLMGSAYLVNVSMCRSFITCYRHSHARSIR